MTPGVASELAGEFREFVRGRLGLDFSAGRQSELEHGLRATATELGLPEDMDCAQWLMAHPTKQHLDVLATHLTIGETYFFRDRKSFEALEQRILPDLIASRRATTRRLRIWSAGCCTGEEAYSIAIVLSRLLPNPRDWRIMILGTDLNSRFLRKAAEATYTSWSFRGVTAEEKDRFFTEIEPGRFTVSERVRKLVTFAPLNLVEDAYPSLSNNTNAMDLIFCRNVVMYFSTEEARRVLSNLSRCLLDGGYLFTSASESSPELLPPTLVPAGFPGTIVHRKRDLPQVAPQVKMAAPETKPRLKRATASKPAAGKPLPIPENPVSLARRLASEGRFREALAACDEALAQNKLAPVNHYLRGMILQEQGAVENAVVALKRALFLDHDFILAHLALGGLMQRANRRKEAARFFENARDLLQAMDAGALLPEGDGMTAGQLLATLRSVEENAV